MHALNYAPATHRAKIKAKELVRQIAEDENTPPEKRLAALYELLDTVEGEIDQLEQ